MDTELTAKYSVRDAVTDEGMFFYCHNCKNRMYSVRKNKMLYNGAECPKCKKILYLEDNDED